MQYLHSLMLYSFRPFLYCVLSTYLSAWHYLLLKNTLNSPLHPISHLRLCLVPFSLSLSSPSLPQTLTPSYSSFPGFSFGLQPHSPEDLPEGHPQLCTCPLRATKDHD